MIIADIAEAQMIDAITRLHNVLKQKDASTKTIDTFYDVGEWLLCFEGMIITRKNYPSIFENCNFEFNLLREYFREYIADLE